MAAADSPGRNGKQHIAVYVTPLVDLPLLLSRRTTISCLIEAEVFNRSGTGDQATAGATEDDHLALLGVLNSSTACFWLKQNS